MWVLMEDIAKYTTMAAACGLKLQHTGCCIQDMLETKQSESEMYGTIYY